jgi:ABC-type sugar transport system ATPase subunit
LPGAWGYEEHAVTDVSIENLHKSFGKTEVLRGIDLSIAQGEFVAILGESGCGKSTLLRIVAGLDDETSGRVLIGGRDVAGLSPIERDIAMVFQSYALYPHMTARANIAFPLELAGMGRPEIARLVDHAPGLLDLTAHLARRPRQLSGGQRQRVAMGRAIVREPGVFLFD